MLGLPRSRRPNRSRDRYGSSTSQSRRENQDRPPILVRQVRNGIEESVHRGDIVEVDATGRLLRAIGDVDRVVTLRSTVKPFGLVALVEAGGIEEFDLDPAELAIMASSHSGEDLHVRTLQGVYRRGCQPGVAGVRRRGMPLDALDKRAVGTGRRAAGTHPPHVLRAALGVSPAARLKGWDPQNYWTDEHPAQQAYRTAVARAYDTPPARLRTAIDGCGLPTYAFPLRAVARAFALLADPASIPSSDPRSSLAPALLRIRDAMLANPEMVGGRHDRLDTSLMKAAPDRLVSKSGMEALRGVAILPGPASASTTRRRRVSR